MYHLHCIVTHDCLPEITFKFNPACNTHGVKEGTFGLHIEGINNEKAIQDITRAECARKVRKLILSASPSVNLGHWFPRTLIP